MERREGREGEGTTQTFPRGSNGCTRRFSEEKKTETVEVFIIITFIVVPYTLPLCVMES